MKKLSILCFAFVLSLPLFSQDAKIAATQFDQVLLQKGSLIVKEFVPFGKFNKIEGEIAVLTNISTGSKTYALRITSPYYKSQYDNGETSSVFDAKELESAINAIDFMISKNKEIASTAPYTEMIYRGSGEPEFGFYVSGSERKGFFKVDYKATVYFDVSNLEMLKQFFITGKNKIAEIGGKIE